MRRRQLGREVLDHLSAGDPDAQASRNDLRRVNRIMRHDAILARRLRQRPGRIVDLGSGDGMFALRLAQRLPRPRDLVLVDRVPGVIAPRALQELHELGWQVQLKAEDVMETELREGDVVVANLFLHHFDNEQLRQLFAHVAERAGALLACEPRRSMLALAATHALVLLGMHPITRHDGALSVKAGFRDRELTRLWPASQGWTLEERRVGPFSHGFFAVRC